MPFDDDAINTMITVGKRIVFSTRSFGSDTPPPDPSILAGWVREHRGRSADLISYFLEEGLVPQVEADVTLPCAGGRFYRRRWQDALTGIEDSVITAEPGCDATQLVADAVDLGRIRKNLRVAIPAPHVLALKDQYFKDSDEADHSLSAVYGDMMRAMRDAGIAGHIVCGERAIPEELAALAGKKVFFFSRDQTARSLSSLLEHQAAVAVRPSALPTLEELMGEYDVQTIILLDPGELDLRQALTIKDQDQLICGGYCRESCDSYWRDLVEKAMIRR
jgi:hypothetical protein